MSVESSVLSQQLSTPHASKAVFELPCGYLDPATQEVWSEVEVSEITGREEDMLASEEVPGEAKMEALLAACVKRIGPITDRGRIAAMISDLTGGDRLFLMFAIRRVTLGNDVTLREQCPNKVCRTKTLFTIDLRELTVKKMENPLKRVYDVTTPSGRPVRFRVSTGHDEKRVSRALKKEKADAISLMMMMRIELIDGVTPDLNAIKGMGMKDRVWLRDQFTSVEGGIDTNLDLECPKCGHEWAKEFAVAASGFFSLSGTSKR